MKESFRMNPGKAGRTVALLCALLLLVSMSIWVVIWAHQFLEQKYNDPEEAARNRDLVRRTYDNIRLGMTIEEVNDEISRQKWPEECCLRSYLEKQEVIILETPFELGAKNWVLHLMFAEGELAAYVVRTMDSESENPPDSLPDLVKEGFELPGNF